MNYESDLPAMTTGLCEECGYDLLADLDAMFFTRTDGTMTCAPCAETEIRFIVARGIEQIERWLSQR